MSSKIILETQDLTRNFGALCAVDHVSIDFVKGESHAIIGPNGAGKSTLIDLILNRTSPNSGKVFFRGAEISQKPDYQIANMGLCKCFQISKLFPSLTCYENIKIALFKKNNKVYDFLPKKSDYMREEALAILNQVGMADKIDDIASLMSYGDQRRLEIAITLAMEPQILFLDEPTAGVARAEGYEIMEMIHRLAEKNQLTVIFIEHDMEIVFNHAQRISVMNHGKLVATDSPERIRENQFVKEAYFGGVV